MTTEPTEWHSFGDPPQPVAASALAPAPAAAPGPMARTSGPHGRGSAEAQRRPWIAAGLGVLALAVGVVVFVLAVALAGGGRGDSVVIAARSEQTPRGSGSATLPGPSGAAVDSPLVVDVEGAVRSPGLHHLAAGARVGDAIAAAGGYADRADLGAAAQTLNLAAVLADGAKVRVPLLGEQVGAFTDGLGATAAPADGGSHAGSSLIDLNHADEAALESLPGIGPVTAGKIIAARESGPFASLDDVVNRKALSASVLDKIRAFVTVSR